MATFSTNDLKSKVILYKEQTKHGTRYAVRYQFGREFSDKSILKLTALCNTIAFREHYRSIFGEYPKEFTPILFFDNPSRVHCVSFMDTDMTPAIRMAEQISYILKIDCNCTFMKIIPTWST